MRKLDIAELSLVNGGLTKPSRFPLAPVANRTRPRLGRWPSERDQAPLEKAVGPE